MSHTTISTEGAPSAIGPYSQAVVAKPGTMLFVSGQIPFDPKTMKLIGEGIKEQTTQVLENVKAVVEAANCTLSHVVKTTIFLTNMEDFAEVNKIYEQYFGAFKPARATVEVSRLPKNVKVEIDAIAIFAE